MSSDTGRGAGRSGPVAWSCPLARRHGFLEALLFAGIACSVAVVALYRVIRLGVRHGIQDTQRHARADQAAAGIAKTIRRQQATYGGSEPE